MNGWHHIDDEILFWTTLREVRDFHCKTFDAMSVDEVLREMMKKSGGRLNPHELRIRLEEVEQGPSATWRRIALWLADCHAATAEYDGRLKSTSGARRNRFAEICRRAAGMIRYGHYTGRDQFTGGFGSRTKADIVKRLEGAAEGVSDGRY